MRILHGLATPERSRLVASLALETRELACAHIQMRAYEQDEVIYRIGDPIPGPCFVEQGLVAYFRRDERELRYLMGVQWPVQIAGLSLMPDREWPVAVMALTPLVWGSISFEVHQQIAERLPHVFPTLVGRLANQYHVETNWFSRLVSVSLRPRLRMIIHRLAQELGVPYDGGVLLDFRVTGTLLSLLARANRDEVGRALRDLLRQGLVARQPGRRLVVPNLDGLVEGVPGDDG
jgi:CRP-like cAMP-binding protein